MKYRVMGLMAAALVAPSAMASIGGSAFRLDATSDLGSGFIDVSVDNLTYSPGSDMYHWQMEGPQEIRSVGGALIATLEQASVNYVVDPVIGLNFVVTSGGSATNFTITSALLSFANINPAEGQASAGATVTDMNGDGASFTGLNQGKAYGAYYNGFIANQFTPLVDSLAAASNGTAVGSESYGFAGMGSVNDMSSQWHFQVSAFDSASGTSRYEVRPVPEPASLAALALGAVGLLRRRRAR